MQVGNKPCNPQASFLGLPTELRLDILSYAFAHALRHRAPLTLRIGECVCTCPSCIFTCCQEPYSILTTCRQLFQDILHLLYAKHEVLARVHGQKSLPTCPGPRVGDICMGPPKDLLTWNFVKKVALYVTMERTVANRKIVPRRLEELCEALAWGSGLTTLTIQIEMDERRGMPSYYARVVRILKQLGIKSGGTVKVLVDNDDEEDFNGYAKDCREMEATITGEDHGK